MENENTNHDHGHSSYEHWFYHDDAERDLYSMRYSCRRMGIPYCLFYIRGENDHNILRKKVTLQTTD